MRLEPLFHNVMTFVVPNCGLTWPIECPLEKRALLEIFRGIIIEEKRLAGFVFTCEDPQ